MKKIKNLEQGSFTFTKNCFHSCRNASEQGRTDVQITIGSRDDKGRTPLHIAAITGKQLNDNALLNIF